MHEMSICEGIVQILEEQAKAQDYRQVKKVWLEIGPFAGIELDALHFCFDVVARGTLSENAELHVIQPDAQAWCLACSKTVNIKARYDSCPHCSSHQLQITAGDELRIKELEVE